MGTGNPGFQGKLEVSDSAITSQGDGDKVQDVTSCTFTVNETILDQHTLDNTSVNQLKGQQDAELTFTGKDLSVSRIRDIEDAFRTKNRLYFAWFPDNTNDWAFTGKFCITSSSITSEIDSADTMEITAMLDDSDGISHIDS